MMLSIRSYRADDAPTSALAVIYTPEGEFAEYFPAHWGHSCFLI
ncbi:glycerol dehydrogenase [Vibrio parahaemolyticus AQ3810]|nr:glycerol dehydrogenase [Vibrio parahaemolyticus AQ3810]